MWIGFSEVNFMHRILIILINYLIYKNQDLYIHLIEIKFSSF